MTARRAGPFLVAWAATAVAWSWPLVWNRYPFFFFDTEAYLHQAAGRRAFLLRPVYYSEFLRFFRGTGGLLAAVAVQLALVALAAVVFVFRVSPPEARTRVLLAVGLGGALTPAAFHFCIIMPDAFAFMFAISITALAIEKAWLATGAWAVTAALSGSLHFSFLALGLILTPLVLLTAMSVASGVRRAAVAAGGVLVVVVVSICANAALAGAGFRLISGGPIFLAGRLAQDQTLSPILRRRASASTDPAECRRLIRFAEDVEHLPPATDKFLWRRQSPLNRDFPNAWTDLAQFFRLHDFCASLVAEGLTRYPGPFLVSGLRNAIWMATGKGTLGNFTRLPPSTPTDDSLRSYGGREERAFRSGRQGSGEIAVEELRPLVLADKIIDPVVFLAGGALLVVLALQIVRSLRRRAPVPVPSAAAFLLLGALVANVVVCGVLSTGSSRYHERMILAGILGIVLWSVARPSDAGSAGELTDHRTFFSRGSRTS